MPVPSTPETKAAAAATVAMPSSTVAVSTTERYALEPNVRYFLVAHPLAWEVATEGLDAPALVPVLSPVFAVPGSAGMKTAGKGEPPETVWSDALKVHQAKGSVLLDPNAVIPSEFLPAGVPPGTYCRELPCVGPRTGRAGTYFCEPWDVPTARVAGLPQRFKRDRGAYNKWRKSLVDQAVVACPEEVAAGLLDTAERAVVRARNLPMSGEVRDGKVSAALANLNAVKAATGSDELGEVLGLDSASPKGKKS